MKKLLLDYKIWSFNECHNFIILPYIVTKYKKNTKIVAVCTYNGSDLGTFSARCNMQIENVMYCRLCDIPNFKNWQLYRSLDLNNYFTKTSDDGRREQLIKCAVMFMNYLYDVQNETDIVTVLTVTPEFKYKGENLIYEKIIGAKAV